MTSKGKDWRNLAQRASTENDPDKLLNLIDELINELEEREGEARQKLSRSTTISPQRGRKLLFVDDESSIRLTLPQILVNHGFDVTVAANVNEALEQLKRNRFDILLSDINISEEGDGFTVVHAARQADPGCVTVLLTGYPAFESALAAIHNEVDDYLVKPADIDVLIGTINRKLAARSTPRGL